MYDLSKASIIVGLQFGDEGKGKMVDVLSETNDWVVRFSGGNNAGHTVVVNDKTYKFHLLPSGMARNKKSAIAAGCIVDPKVLLEELKQFSANAPPLHIDPRSHVILPYHVLQDQGNEQAAGNQKIGTTGRGIGPCYSDRALRIGIRFGDFIQPQKFKQKLIEMYNHKKPLLDHFAKGMVPLPESIFEEYQGYAKQLSPFVSDVSLEIFNALQNHQTILFEGAQGTFLDTDFGTYPFVTSSHPLAANAFIGTGIGPVSNCRIIGITKAYLTRVGNGPFPTELDDKTGELLRQKGQEFGTTTGRARRCGWLDLPQLRTAVRLNGITEIAVMKMDVLHGFDEVKVCTHYELNGKKLFESPIELDDWTKCKPVYESFQNFECDSTVSSFEALPKQTLAFVRLIETSTKTPVSVVSIGPERTQTLTKNQILEKQ